MLNPFRPSHDAKNRRPEEFQPITRRQGFNPRAPRGTRPDESKCGKKIKVSIHAPRAGRDQRPGLQPPLLRCFNPRAPRGTRLNIRSQIESVELFQSTRPARDATRAPRIRCSGRLCFNPRAPRGTRQAQVNVDVVGLSVSIHAPRAGRDRRNRSQNRRADVSIHAPRAGRDPRL